MLDDTKKLHFGTHNIPLKRPPIISSMGTNCNGYWTIVLMGYKRELTIRIPAKDVPRSQYEGRRVYENNSGQLNFNPPFSNVENVSFPHWQLSVQNLKKVGSVLTIRIKNPKTRAIQTVRFGLWLRSNASPGELRVWVSRVNKKMSRAMGEVPRF